MGVGQRAFSREASLGSVAAARARPLGDAMRESNAYHSFCRRHSGPQDASSELTTADNFLRNTPGRWWNCDARWSPATPFASTTGTGERSRSRRRRPAGCQQPHQRADQRKYVPRHRRDALRGPRPQHRRRARPDRGRAGDVLRCRRDPLGRGHQRHGHATGCKRRFRRESVLQTDGARWRSDRPNCDVTFGGLVPIQSAARWNR